MKCPWCEKADLYRSGCCPRCHFQLTHVDGVDLDITEVGCKAKQRDAREAAGEMGLPADETKEALR